MIISRLKNLNWRDIISLSVGHLYATIIFNVKIEISLICFPKCHYFLFWKLNMSDINNFVS